MKKRREIWAFKLIWCLPKLITVSRVRVNVNKSVLKKQQISMYPLVFVRVIIAYGIQTELGCLIFKGGRSLIFLIMKYRVYLQKIKTKIFRFFILY